MKIKRNLVGWLVVVSLVGCGGTVQPGGVVGLSDSDIQQDANYEALLIALQDANVQLAGKSESANKDDFARRAMIEDRLVELAIIQLETDFTAQREASGVLPVPTIDEIAAELQGAEDVSELKWAQVQERVTLEKKSTRNYVDTEADKLNQNISNGEKLDLLTDLYRLSGSNQWRRSRESFIDTLLAEVRDARARGQYTEPVQAQGALVRQARSDDQALAEELASFDARVYENSFLSALSTGDLDQAYGVFSTMAGASNFARVATKLEGTSQTMAEYFLAKADESVLRGRQMSKSIRLYTQAQDMFDRFQLGPVPPERYKSLVDRLAQRFRARMKAQEYEAALAYLLVIGDFDSSHTEYKTQLASVKASVRQAAVRKLTPLDFVNADRDLDYSDVLASFITQYLFEHIPNDVRIIERQQYQAILRDRERKRQRNLPSPVDYLISGDIVKAKVSSSEIQGRKVMRVVVGHDQSPNPAYNSWLQLTADERASIPAPPQTIDKEMTENVSVGVTEHRKLAVFTLNYQLMEAEGKKALLPGTVTKDTELKDNSTEGVEIGEFVMPFKLARLPSDAEILDGLAKEIATEVGAKLVESLSNQEEKYLASASDLANAGNCQAQLKALGRAAAMQEMKGLNSDSTVAAMKDVVIDCY